MKKLLKALVLCGILFPTSGIRPQNAYTKPVMDFDMPPHTVICADDGSY